MYKANGASESLQSYSLSGNIRLWNVPLPKEAAAGGRGGSGPGRTRAHLRGEAHWGQWGQPYRHWWLCSADTGAGSQPRTTTARSTGCEKEAVRQGTPEERAAGPASLPFPTLPPRRPRHPTHRLPRALSRAQSWTRFLPGP